MKKKVLGIGFMLSCLVLAVILLIFPPSHWYQSFKTDTDQSLEIPQWVLAFQLETHKGTMIPFQDLLHKPLILATGFTRCPDVCPATMMFLDQLLKSQGSKIHVGLLTVDPGYDTSAQMNRYLSAWPKDFWGLRIESLPKLNHVLDFLSQPLHSKIQSSDNQAHSIHGAHTNFVYLFLPSGRYKLFFNQDSQALEMNLAHYFMGND